MTNVGICQELAGEYVYYLLQVGINASTCSAMDVVREYSHEWTIIELDGEHYHVDPTFTLNYKNCLAFFCMNDEMREQYGNFDVFILIITLLFGIYLYYEYKKLSYSEN